MAWSEQQRRKFNATQRQKRKTASAEVIPLEVIPDRASSRERKPPQPRTPAKYQLVLELLHTIQEILK